MTRRSATLLRLVLLLGCVMLICGDAFSQCALCRQALAKANPGVVKGFYMSIIVILSVPLTILLVASRWVVKAYRGGIVTAARTNVEPHPAAPVPELHGTAPSA
jgi:hypothetical protein